MSTFFSWQHAILKSELEPTTKLVCHTIGCHMAADGSGCFPSYQTIADESGLGRSTVINHVGKALDAGYLEAESRQRKDGSNSSNLYRQSFPPSPAAGLGWSSSGTGGSPAAGPPLTTQSNNPDNNPPVSPKPTKASSRANPSQRLSEHLAASGGIPPVEWGEWAHTTFGWDADRISFEWDDFFDYWNSGNAKGGGRKSDWAATWRSHCRRQSSDSRRGYRAGGKARSGFATAFASSVANRYGIPSAGGGVGGGKAAEGAGANPRPRADRLPNGEIPF